MDRLLEVLNILNVVFVQKMCYEKNTQQNFKKLCCGEICVNPKLK